MLHAHTAETHKHDPTALPAAARHTPHRASSHRRLHAAIPAAAAPTLAAALVQSVLATPGRPLDPGTRAFMEARFGQDFSAVRVHADTQAAHSAALLDAHAYTAGDHIVLRAYPPATAAGLGILAHELAHTIQQRGAAVAAHPSSDLEGAAHQAAARVMGGLSADVRPAAVVPALQFLRVTPRGFGRALEEYTNIHAIPDAVVGLLRRSASFMQTAQILDAHFVWRTDSFNWESRNQPLQYDANQRITNGPPTIQGKREFMVVGGASGAAFLPFGAPGNILSGDIILLNPTDDADFLRSIAHEAAHAQRFVTQSGPAPATLAAAVAAGLQEEVDVRLAEQQVVGEIARLPAARGMRFGAAPTTVPAEVERQFSPGLGLTYLESFFFDFRLRETQTAEGLSDDEASDIRTQVDRGLPGPPLIFGKTPSPRSGLFELSTYAETYFAYKTAQREWAELRQRVRPDDPAYPAQEERMRQDHARRFFAGRVAYRALPAPATP